MSFSAAVLAALCTGCATPRHELLKPGKPVYAAAGSAVREASYSRRHSYPLPAAPRSLDALAEQLLHATAGSLDLRRRIALENLANAHTRAYKRRLANTTVQQIGDGNGGTCSVPVAAGSTPVFAAGGLERTGLQLDLAIDGEGLFAVTGSDGSTIYTRDGRFALNADGKLVTNTGMIVLPEITVPIDVLRIEITPDGIVTGVTAGSPDCDTRFGQLNVHRFVNPAGMQLEGSHWRPSEASGQPTTGTPGSIGLGLLRQGFIECSNVRPDEERRALQQIERERSALFGTFARTRLRRALK